MDFIESINTCLIKKYWNPKGRASRSEFVYFCLFFFSLMYMLLFIPVLIPFLENDYWHYSPIILIIILGCPTCSLAVRRLHDLGYSGYWWIPWWLVQGSGRGIRIETDWFDNIYFLIFYIFVYLFIVYYFFLRKGDESSNKYGPNPIKNR